MEKIFKIILNHKKTVVILFGILTIVCYFLKGTVLVNYDMMDYLPDSAPSTKALDLMKEEYEGGIPNARVMLPDMTIPQALEMKEKLLAIDGVDDITWLDDAADIKTPLSMLDQKTVQDYYKNGFALFNVTVNEEKQLQAVDEMEKLIGQKGSMTGAAVNTATSIKTTSEEVGRIVLFIIPICFIILLLTTTSWFEPVLFMVTIGAAIAINSGTNAMFGEISFVTNAAGNILQLAVSMDYSIFLLHRFSESRKEGLDVQSAMLDALKKSVISIASSGLTTVIGFAALLLMNFKIGPDMGRALAKGVAFSMISVLILLPVLALLFYKLIDKTQHRSFLPSFNHFGGLISKIKAPVMVIFLIIIVPSYLAQINNSFSYGSSKIFDDDTKMGQQRVAIEEVFGKSNNLVLMVPKGDFATETELSNSLKDISQVSSIISYVDNAGAEIPTEYMDSDTLSKLISAHYSRMVLNVKTDYEDADAFDVVEKIRETAGSYYKEYYLAGESVNTYDLKNTVEADNIRVNTIAIGAIFLVLLFTFKSAILPFVLILVIETAVWLNLSVPYFADDYLYYIAYLIISSIQLGATVDYAILLTGRYIELRKGNLKKDCIRKTIMGTASSILTSASILTLAGLLLNYVCTNGVIAQLGMLVGRGAVISTALVLFVLPAMLYLLDKPIQKTTIGLSFKNN